MSSLFILLLNYVLFPPSLSFKRYFIFAFIVTCFGAFHDWQLTYLGLMLKESYCLGYLSLWIVFACYFSDIFRPLIKFSNISLGFLGGVGGSFAYWSAYRLGSLKLTSESSLFSFLGIIFLFWMIFFPLSLRIFMLENVWVTFLDKMILFSFDRSGFKRHQKRFSENLNFQGAHAHANKRALVTGGTSGIGAAVASALSTLGVKVDVTGRNEEKGQSFALENEKMNFLKLDCADWKELQVFSQNCDSFDFIVLNAGAMPELLELNAQGVEMQCASQLLGHYFLIYYLKTHLKLNPEARIVWVSSGGLYLKELDIDSLFGHSHYDKVSTYANVKRAQVTLVEELAKQEFWKEIHLFCMHPGWVATSGLKASLPHFSKVMKNRLRTPIEGADTIIWLLLTNRPMTSGQFYFDRKKVLPYFWNHFNPSLSKRALLLQKIEKFKTELET